MATGKDSSWFPLFEFQDYLYQSFLILPTVEESAAPPGTTITTKKMGDRGFRVRVCFRRLQWLHTITGQMNINF